MNWLRYLQYLNSGFEKIQVRMLHDRVGILESDEKGSSRYYCQWKEESLA